MARKSATLPKEPASLPDVLIPPSEAAANQRSAYWLQLIENPEEFKAAIATEEFFPMLLDFPAPLWERLSLYLYRLTDDTGFAIRNAPNAKGYLPGGVLHQAIQEEDVARKWGGGKFRVYLKLDSKTTLREYVFYIDAPPKVLPGQVVEIEGKPVQLPNSAPAPAAPAATDSALDKVIDANSRANESSMEIVTSASKAAIAMVQDQARNAATPVSPLADIKTLLEIIRPAQDPVQQELMKAIIAKAFAPPAAPIAEDKETPVEQTLSAIKELSGGLSLAELMKPAGRAPLADPVTAWAPIVQTAGQVALSFFDKLPNLFAQRTEQLRLELAIRQTGTVPPIPGQPARLPAPQVVGAPPTPAPAPQPNMSDPQALVGAMIRLICEGFDKGRHSGADIAAALDVQFGEQIEALGIAQTLANPAELDKFIVGIQPLAQRSQDPRWSKYREEFLSYTTEVWGDDEADKAAEAPGAGPQAVDGAKPPAA